MGVNVLTNFRRHTVCAAEIGRIHSSVRSCRMWLPPCSANPSEMNASSRRGFECESEASATHLRGRSGYIRWKPS